MAETSPLLMANLAAARDQRRKEESVRGGDQFANLAAARDQRRKEQRRSPQRQQQQQQQQQSRGSSAPQLQQQQQQQQQPQCQRQARRKRSSSPYARRHSSVNSVSLQAIPEDEITVSSVDLSPSPAAGLGKMRRSRSACAWPGSGMMASSPGGRNSSSSSSSRHNRVQVAWPPEGRDQTSWPPSNDPSPSSSSSQSRHDYGSTHRVVSGMEHLAAVTSSMSAAYSPSSSDDSDSSSDCDVLEYGRYRSSAGYRQTRRLFTAFFALVLSAAVWLPLLTGDPGGSKRSPEGVQGHRSNSSSSEERFERLHRNGLYDDDFRSLDSVGREYDWNNADWYRHSGRKSGDGSSAVHHGRGSNKSHDANNATRGSDGSHDSKNATNSDPANATSNATLVDLASREVYGSSNPAYDLADPKSWSSLPVHIALHNEYMEFRRGTARTSSIRGRRREATKFGICTILAPGLDFVGRDDFYASTVAFMRSKEITLLGIAFAFYDDRHRSGGDDDDGARELRRQIAFVSTTRATSPRRWGRPLLKSDAYRSSDLKLEEAELPPGLGEVDAFSAKGTAWRKNVILFDQMEEQEGKPFPWRGQIGPMLEEYFDER